MCNDGYWHVSEHGLWLKEGALFLGGGGVSSTVLTRALLEQFHLVMFLDIFLAAAETPAGTKKEQQLFLARGKI